MAGFMVRSLAQDSILGSRQCRAGNDLEGGLGRGYNQITKRTAMNPFLERFEFAADPFEFTNADEEPHLAEYFVPPPYFPAVLGDPENRVSPSQTLDGGAGNTHAAVALRTFLCAVF